MREPICPFATWRPIDRNFTYGRAIPDGKVEPWLIVDHIADGLGDPYAWFNADRPDPSSAHLWIARSGQIVQYVRLTDTAWSNGNVRTPNLRIPIVATITRRRINPNAVSISVEHEGYPETVLTTEQIAASRRLHRWISEEWPIPLDREHVIGHSDLDSSTRAHCPGPHFPWDAILNLTPVETVTAQRSVVEAIFHELWRLTEELARIEHPDRAVALQEQIVKLKIALGLQDEGH